MAFGWIEVTLSWDRNATPDVVAIWELAATIILAAHVDVRIVTKSCYVCRLTPNSTLAEWDDAFAPERWPV
jgi:hypothetical protein